MSRKAEKMIRSLLSCDWYSWDEYLVDFGVAYNSWVEATKTFTPSYLSYKIDRATISIWLLSSSIPATGSFLYSIKKTAEEAQKAIRRSSQPATENGNKEGLPVEYKVENLVCFLIEIFGPEQGFGSRKLHSGTVDHSIQSKSYRGFFYPIELSALIKTKKNTRKNSCKSFAVFQCRWN